MKKKILALLTIVMMLTSVIAYGDSPKVNIASYKMNGNEMKLNYSVTPESKEASSPADTNVKIGVKNYKIKNIQTLKESALPQNYVFLVDVSGSLNKTDLKNLKNLVTKVASLAGEKDQFQIYTFSDDVKEILQLTSEKNLLDSKIGEITARGQNTSLYGSVDNVLGKIVNNKEDTAIRNNLVVVSDGIEDYKKGKSPEEIYATIEKSGVPIYSVSLAKKRSEYEKNKIFSSFANKSPGGLSLFLGEIGVEKAATDIVNSANSSKVATVDLSKFDVKEAPVDLSLDIEKINAKGQKSLQQTDIKIIQNSILNNQPKNQLKDKTDQEESKEGETKEEKTKSKTPMLIAALVIVLCAIAGLVFALMKGKKGVYKIILKDDTNPKNTRSFPLKKDVTIGRKASNDICYKGDNMLSSDHCVIFIEDGMIFVKDLNSTNGTYVNGIKVGNRSRLKNNDILLIGSMELKVIIED